MRLTYEEAVKRYGAIENGRWADESKWCILFEVPEEIAKTWVNSATGLPTHRIYLNREMAPELKTALKAVTAAGLVSQLKTFDGAFCIRDVRAQPGHPSCHSYDCALDINASENRLGKEPSMSPELVACFTGAGFSWGGTFKRKDGMHFSCAAWE